MSLIDVIVAIIAVLVFGISYTVIFLDFVKYVGKFESERVFEEDQCPSEESED